MRERERDWCCAFIFLFFFFVILMTDSGKSSSLYDVFTFCFVFNVCVRVACLLVVVVCLFIVSLENGRRRGKVVIVKFFALCSFSSLPQFIAFFFLFYFIRIFIFAFIKIKKGNVKKKNQPVLFFVVQIEINEMCIGTLLASCCATCFVNCCCSGLKECNAKRGPASRIPYIFIMFVACVFSVVMTLYGEKQLYSNSLLNTSLKVCNKSSCEGNGVVYRTSFALALFFIIHAILVRAFMAFHWMFLIIKLLFLQVLVLVNWAWDVSDNVLAKLETLESEKSEENDNKCKIGCYQMMLVVATLFLIGAMITLWALMFVWFGKTGCTTSKVLISLTIIAAVALFIISVSVQHGSIFVTGIVTLYGSYLCYNGLQSRPQESCNAFAGEKNTLNLWLGILITAAALSYAGFSVASSTNKVIKQSTDESGVDLKVKKEVKDKEDKDDTADAEDVGKSNYDDLDDDEDKKPKKSLSGEVLSEDDLHERRHNVIFHICMAFASIYISMLYTNWATDTASSTRTSGRGDISLGVNIAAEWLSFLLYFWTLIAPSVCSNRSFDQ
ncbi:serine incorporator 3 [Reticulomyxa filosa]|uniref:Serine incorporator 3 n=1 Tax=Reticulomyxa filosa TaxID=46433 RepID=X6MDC2_RETFI|nr:serine incorporator 3 [Reticulomyxa filosa]|eukprot:ETO12023.1 serine incorporator 3 [Reticulomyxa filosa]